MDTKLNRFSHSVWGKTILFFLVLFLFSNVAVKSLYLVSGENGDLDLILEDSFEDSLELDNLYRRTYDKLTTIAFYYGNENRIKSGEAIKQKHLAYRLEQEYYGRIEYNNDTHEPILSQEEFYNENPDIRDKIINQMKIEQMINYKNLQRSLKQDKNISRVEYYVSNGQDVYSSGGVKNKDEFRKFPIYFLSTGIEEENFKGEIEYVQPRTDGEMDLYNFGATSWEDEMAEYEINEIYPIDDREIYIAFPQDLVDELKDNWTSRRIEARSIVAQLAVNLALLIFVFIIYAGTLGRDYWGSQKVVLNSFDRIYTDVNLLMCIALIFIWSFIAVEVILSRGAYKMTSLYNDSYNVMLYITAFLGSFGLALISSLIKHFKNRTLITSSLIYKVLKSIFNFFGSIFRSSSLGKKIAALLIIYPLLVVGSLIFFPIVIALAIYFALKKVKDFEEIQNGVRKIKSGELNYQIKVNDKGNLKELSSNINEIGEGLESAIDNELKSERMKSELITNVSHDIRTPLTSIITYVDLLKNEDDESKKQDYIEVIDNKSLRLKVLIDDLFEASKVSSGNIPINLEQIDLTALLSQGIGEVADRIEENNLEFKINLPKEEVNIIADGDLLWRAIENLFTNIFKYSLHGSRVYIDVYEDGEDVFLVMKNISAYELNISEGELMERFKRGDESRTSEGSGLGLSITESLIDAQKGEFKIEIDGDLFKTTIKLKKYNTSYKL